MSVSTPILTTSSEICAIAAEEASSAAASVPNMDSLLAIILFPSLDWRIGPLLLEPRLCRPAILVSFATILEAGQRAFGLMARGRPAQGGFFRRRFSP
ncbi:hypothetical protein MTX20_18620 [Bradyrhizobium sp. ISRA435]|nr:hypothetical protein MTX20_18620 [Bradyrhizobium sp. ISRA435]